MLNTFTPDDCCGVFLADAMLEGQLDEAMSWCCPKCEQDWRCTLHKFEPGEGLRHWSPYSPVMIFNARRKA